MKIEALEPKGLTREFRMRIPAEMIREKTQEWLQEKGRKVSLDGFRPGKVPVDIVEKHYKADAIHWAVRHLFDKIYKQLQQEQNLRPALDPDFEVEQAYDGESQDHVVKVIVDELPEVSLKDFSEITLEHLSIIVPEEEIVQTLEKIAGEHKSFVKADESYVSQAGDQVEFGAKTTLNKKFLKDYSIKKVKLPIPDLDKLTGEHFFQVVFSHLAGKKAGDTFSFSHTFSPSHKDKSVAGKTVDVDVTVYSIEVPKLHSVGDELAQSLKMDSLEALKKSISERLQESYAQTARLYHKRYLLDELSKAYLFSVPDRLVEIEFQNIWSRLQRELEDEPEALEKEEKTEEELKKEYRDIADRRVRLGVIIGRVAKEHNLSVTDEMVRYAILNEIERSPYREREIIRFYRNNHKALEYLRSTILEDLVVDFLLEKITTKDVSITPKELKEKMQTVLPGYGEEV